MCYFSFILFAVGLGLTIYGWMMLKYIKHRHWVPRSYKDKAKWHLSETCMQSVIIIGILEFFAVIITKVLYEVGMKNSFVKHDGFIFRVYKTHTRYSNHSSLFHVFKICQ